jgi:hypothetical protein
LTEGNSFIRLTFFGNFTTTPSAYRSTA